MPKPVLQAMVLADHVYRDASTGKHIIAGTFTNINVGTAKVVVAEHAEGGERKILTGPVTKIGSPYLYLALVEVHGQVPLELKFVDLADSSVLFEAQLVVTSGDPVAVAEYVVELPPLPVQKLGAYSLDILHESEILGSWRISVKKIEDRESAAEGGQ
jgi:hypothetical protein